MGFAVLCDNKGTISKVLRDDAGIFSTEPIGKLLIHLVDPASRASSLDFLQDIKFRNIAFGYQLQMDYNDSSGSFAMVGVKLSEDILVVGAGSSTDAVEYLNLLQEINNEQANTIRQLVKGNVAGNPFSDSENKFYFDEISFLNNELVNLQRQLAKQNVELGRLNEIKNQFLGMAAHDLRNPLSVILSFAGFLKEEINDRLTEEQAEFLDIISSSATFMLKLIEELLDISKIESGRLTLNLTTIELNTFIAEMVKINNVLSAKKGVEIVFHPFEANISLVADKQKLEQVMNNLLTNAVKFSFSGSKVKVLASCSGSQAMVEVTDAGTGIRKEDMEKLFVPFQRLAAKGTASEKGTGLGLAIVKKIIEGHHGRIWAESEFGKGSSFRFSLPVN